MGTGAFVVLVLARVLTPDPSGLGTHVQLGLPPCLFHALTSVPCPACGLTTSFAHMARLEPIAAARAHPLGVPLFLATLVAVPLSLVGAVRAWPLGPTLRALRVREACWVMLAALLSSWIVRVAGAWPG